MDSDSQSPTQVTPSTGEEKNVKFMHNYRYVRIETPRGEIKLCVSIGWEKLRIADAPGAYLKYRTGLAFCSPKDQFVKRRGRTIADGRLRFALNETRPFKNSEGYFISDSEFRAILPDIVCSAENVPRFAKDAVLNGNYRLGLHDYDDERTTGVTPPRFEEGESFFEDTCTA